MKVYFDGFLPSEKRPTRIARLESSLKQLLSFQLLHCNGFRLQKRAPDSFVSTDSMTSTIFNPSKLVAIHQRGLPALPFIVPAVIETLSNSEYAKVVTVVPGEADLHCALEARKAGGIILTSDSDLLIYDLGLRGAVAFLNEVTLELGIVPGECSKICAQVSTPTKIADRLGLDNLLRLAFEVRKDPSVTLLEAVRRSKANLGTSDSNISFPKFKKEYEDEILEVQDSKFKLPDQVAFQPKRQYLDPRVSELVLQSSLASTGAIYMYLPFLTDDPTRVSAWDVSFELRHFAYSVLLNLGTSNISTKVVYEYSRKGSRVVLNELRSLSDQACSQYAKALCLRLTRVKETFHDMPGVEQWRAFGLAEVYLWYTNSGRTLPSEPALITAMCGKTGKSLLWSHIHLSAQHQAALYALRIAQQILGSINNGADHEDFIPLQRLRKHLECLPSLAELIPSRLELLESRLVSFDIAELLSPIKQASHQDDVIDKGEETENDSTPRSTQTGSFDAWTKVSQNCKSRVHKKEIAKKLLVSKESSLSTNNRYHILENT
ncbi:hypothetical protein MMC06_003708 [Schaereria dolodes]|nr:hypothetical protein [Schaereria dolodes]